MRDVVAFLGVVLLASAPRATAQAPSAAGTAAVDARELQVPQEHFSISKRGSRQPDAASGFVSSPFREEGNLGSQTLDFAVRNEYPAVENAAWTRIAEPYKRTTFYLVTASGEDPLVPFSNDIFTWRFWDDMSTVLEGREVQYTFTTVGKQRVTFSYTAADTGMTQVVDGHVMVKYVRREIRQLTTRDRDAFLGALETLYRLPTQQGRALYGPDYKGIEFFIQMHLEGAGVKECDHWHDDAGIMTHHVGFTLQLEQALQVVDPSVAVPYWEYTIEAEEGYDNYGESQMFDPDWFGDASPDNPLHTMDTGRFAFVPIMEGATDYVHNAYGLLRTPWNLDPTPYVTRHNMTNGQVKMSMVDCAVMAESFESTSMAEFNNWLNGGTHGPVHIMLGGEWDDPEEAFIQATGYAQMTVMITKYLWRKGYLRLPKECTVSDSETGTNNSCRASCPSELYESRGMTPYDVLMDVTALYWTGRFSSGVIKHVADGDYFVVAGHEDDQDFQDRFWQKMLDSFCDPGHVGELFTSAAPYDPLFWVIHPSAERFLNWRRMVGRDETSGRPFDETWGYEHGFVVGETGVVCDWTGVTPDSMEMPKCVTGTCGGHQVLDVLPFQIKINDEIRMMNNMEWLDFIYPDTEDLPYVYNEYRWDHCAASGHTLGTRSGRR